MPVEREKQDAKSVAEFWGERERHRSANGRHPGGPFLYRSYIVLISFLYKNIRTI